jgi:hypothetical protein
MGAQPPPGAPRTTCKTVPEACAFMLTCLICLELAPGASNFALTRLANVKNSINSNSLLKDLDFFLLANYLPDLMTPRRRIPTRRACASAATGRHLYRRVVADAAPHATSRLPRGACRNMRRWGHRDRTVGVFVRLPVVIPPARRRGAWVSAVPIMSSLVGEACASLRLLHRAGDHCSHRAGGKRKRRRGHRQDCRGRQRVKTPRS